MKIKQNIINKSIELGFDKIGFAKCQPLEQEAEFSELSYQSGYFADMNYLYNNLQIKRNPAQLVENAKTIIALAINYYTPYGNNIVNDEAKISRYAWGKDYHDIIKPRLIQLSNFIREEFNSKTFISLDGGKAFEKIWAERAGLGWQGKHSLLITPEYGSWVFLGLIISDLDIEPDEQLQNRCSDCKLCMDNCPNGAIVKAKTIDARKCISYLTIEDRKNNFQSEYINFSNYIYGCDICQQICPWNKSPINSNLSEFEPINSETTLNLELIVEMNEEEFAKRFEASPIKRIKLKKLKSNAEKLKN